MFINCRKLKTTGRETSREAYSKVPFSEVYWIIIHPEMKHFD
jgi:hypothetical protein